MRPKILIIDDNQGDKVLISALLKDVGLDYEVLWAETGEEGMQIVKRESPEIVFLDTLMPGMDGFEVCQEIKKIGLRNTHVIMMTGALDAANEARAKACGADGYCLKLAEPIFRELLRYHKPTSGSDTAKKQVNILLVEDNPGDQWLIKDAIKETGMDIKLSIIEEGEEIVNVAEKLEPKVIFMDIMMPGISGGDAVKLLRDNPKTKNIPVVFLTGIYGRKDELDLKKGINIEGQIYCAIAKPIQVDRLIAEIKKYV